MHCSTERIELDLSSSFVTADGPTETRSGWSVRVRDNDVVGLGESLPLAGWTETQTTCESALARGCQAITAVDDSVSAPVSAGRLLPAPYERILDDIQAPAARHGLSLALLDLRARLLDQPLAALLGGAPGTVQVNATVGDSDPEKTAAAVSGRVAEGYRSIKCKVGARPVTEDRERIAAARHAAGASTALRLDANGGWNLETATSALEWCERHDIEYLEQPLPASQLDFHSELACESVPIALDEGLYEHDLESVIEAGVCSVAVCKPMALGGIDRVLDAAPRLRAGGIEPVVTTTIDGVVATAGATHAAVAIDPHYACGLGTISLFESTVFDPSPAMVSDGSVSVADKPGIGIEP